MDTLHGLDDLVKVVLAGGGINTAVLGWLVVSVIRLQRAMDALAIEVDFIRAELALPAPVRRIREKMSAD